MPNLADDLTISAGILWMFSLLIKGLVAFIIGVYIILFVVYAVCKELYQFFDKIKSNPDTL